MSGYRGRMKRGFILPQTIDPGATVCVSFEIPNDPEYRRATLGHVYELAKWYQWEQTQTGDTRAKQAAELFGQLLDATFVIQECETPPMTPIFRFQDCILQVSYDNGQTWEDVPGWETFAPTCFQGEPGEPGTPGTPGTPGEPGTPGKNVTLNICHITRTWVEEIWLQHLKPFSESVQLSFNTSVPYTEAHDSALFLLNFPPDDEPGSQFILDSMFDNAWNEATGNLQQFINALDDISTRFLIATYYELSLPETNWDGFFTDVEQETFENSMPVSEPQMDYYNNCFASLWEANRRLIADIMHYAPYRYNRLCAVSWCYNVPISDLTIHEGFDAGTAIFAHDVAGNNVLDVEFAPLTTLPSLTRIEIFLQSDNEVFDLVDGTITIDHSGGQEIINFAADVSTPPKRIWYVNLTDVTAIHVGTFGDSTIINTSLSRLKLGGGGTNVIGLDNC